MSYSYIMIGMTYCPEDYIYETSWSVIQLQSQTNSYTVCNVSNFYMQEPVSYFHVSAIFLSGVLTIAKSLRLTVKHEYNHPVLSFSLPSSSLHMAR